MHDVPSLIPESSLPNPCHADAIGQITAAFCPWRCTKPHEFPGKRGRGCRFVRELSPPASSRGADQRGTEPLAASCVTRPKNSPGQNAKILECQRDLSDVTDPAAGQFEERKPSSVSQGMPRAEGQGRRAKPRQRLSASPPSPFSPCKNLASSRETWRVREKPGEFQKTRGFSSSKTWRVRPKPGDFAKTPAISRRRHRPHWHVRPILHHHLINQHACLRHFIIRISLFPQLSPPALATLNPQHWVQPALCNFQAADW